MERDELRKKFDSIEDLPTLPLVVNQILRLIADQESCAQDAAKLILTDHALTAKILKVVNSAFYGFPQRISTVSQAVVILGFNPIKNLLLSVSVFDLLLAEGEKNKPRFDLKKFWGHSLGTAVAAEMIAKKVKYPEPEEVFVAGLLHDIGKVILCLYLPDEFYPILELVLKNELFFYQAEKKLIGTDHSLIGKWVSEKWNLPVVLVNVIRYHHHHHTHIQRLEAKSAKLTAMIRIADTMVKHADIGFSGDYKLPAKETGLMDLIKLSENDYDQIFINLKEGVTKAAAVLNISTEELPNYTLSIQKANIELGKINLTLEQANIALERRLAELSALHAIGNEWRKRRSLDEMLVLICQKIHEVLGFDRVMLGYHHPQDSQLDFQIFIGENCPSVFSWEVTEQSLFNTLFEKRKEIIIADATRESYANEKFFQKINTKRCAIFPISTKEKNVGVIVADNLICGKKISDDDIKSIETFISQASIAFERNELINSLENVNQELQGTNWEMEKKVQRLMAMKSYNQLILESMTNGIVTVNKDMVTIVSNQACEEMLGIKSQEIMGKNINSFAFLENLAQILKQTIENGEPFVRNEIQLSRLSDNKKLILGISTAPLKDKEQNIIIGAIAIFRDLTDLKQMQASLRRKEKLSALGEMAAALAHEIRNPLNPIKGFAQLMEREIAPDDPRREYTQIIIHEVDRLRQMLTHFLEFTHSRELHLENLDINQLVSETLNLISKQEGTSLIMFGSDPAPDLPTVQADENYLKQVLFNLIQNSTDALIENKGEGGEITIRTQADDKYITIDIIDNGPGIATEVRERLFEPFFTTKKNGTGLGLPTCFRIIEDHLGELSFQSEIGESTTFTIRLPILREREC